MKKILRILGTGLAIVIGVLLTLIVGIGFLLFVPFDIIRYHRMPYYKDFKNKYQFFITSKDVVKLYNRIVRDRLPIEYVKNDDFEYFVKDEQVLLCDFGQDSFQQENGEWFFLLDSEYNTKIAMKEALENDVELLKSEHRCLPAKFLIFYSDITDGDRFELAKECPYFHCVFSEDEI